MRVPLENLKGEKLALLPLWFNPGIPLPQRNFPPDASVTAPLRMVRPRPRHPGPGLRPGRIGRVGCGNASSHVTGPAPADYSLALRILPAGAAILVSARVASL